MTYWLTFVLLTLAVYRLTRLVVWDQFPPIKYMRDVVAGDEYHVPRWSRSPHWLRELVTCPWCASGWVSLGAVAATSVSMNVPAPLLWWFAVWGSTSLVLFYEDKHT